MLSPGVRKDLHRLPRWFNMSVLVGFDDTPCGQDALGLARLLSHLFHEPVLVATIWPGDETGVGLALNDLHWVGE